MCSCISRSKLSLPQRIVPSFETINVARLFGCDRRLEDRPGGGRVVTMWDGGCALQSV
jgi:hypothetical protein